MRTKTHSHQDFSKINLIKETYRSIYYEVSYVLLTNLFLKVKTKYFLYESQFVDKNDFIEKIKEYKVFTCKEKGRYYIWRGLTYIPITQKNEVTHVVYAIIGTTCRAFNNDLNIYHMDKTFNKYCTMEQGMYITRSTYILDFYSYEHWHDQDWFIKEWRIKVLKDLTK